MEFASLCAFIGVRWLCYTKGVTKQIKKTGTSKATLYHRKEASTKPVRTCLHLEQGSLAFLLLDTATKTGGVKGRSLFRGKQVVYTCADLPNKTNKLGGATTHWRRCGQARTVLSCVNVIRTKAEI